MTTPRRPRPYVMPEAEAFWAGVAEGKLVVQRCDDCEALVHPPKPVCHYCRSVNRSTVEVSGLGTVVGCTVNHQQWMPGFTPPYSIASVALDEDHRVLFTTNVVGCDPGDVHIGMRVTMDVDVDNGFSYPVFRPTGETGDGLLPSEPDEETIARTVRPMLTTDKFETRTAVTGIGMSRIGRRLMVNPLELTLEACRAAVADAGLTFDDIDGLGTYPGSAAMGGHSEGGTTAVEAALRLRPTWHAGSSEIPGQGGALVTAMLAIAGGLCRHVLLFRTVWEATATERIRRGLDRPLGGGVVGAPRDWSLPWGAGSAANVIALKASQHFARYGTTRETLGRIAVNSRTNAGLNPTAIYREPITLDDYLEARMITTPFGLYDCDVPCDGSVAIVLSARDAARDLAHPPVLIEAVGTQILEPMEWESGTLVHEPQTMGPAAHLWSRTDLRPADVDVALLYDGFSFNCLSWIEALGFCGVGEAKDFIGDGSCIALDGELPLNTHGGQLSHGRTHGFGFYHEAITQLRGDAGDRQVDGADVVVVTTGGLTPGGATLLTRDH